MVEPKSPIRETDDDARALGRQLLHQARFAALATLEPDTGHPLASRIAFGLDGAGRPISLMSTLAYHTKALIADARCSLLVGEPGKGDPLAHPRMTLQATATLLDKASEDHLQTRAHYLTQHPKAALYVDFGDFFLFRFTVETAYLNGGFGKAFVLTADDLGCGAGRFSEQVRERR
ncbi:MAG: pyridoxamine 5'-phosphate oxidase family protein [Hyphomicrobiales bacterium]